MHPMPDPNIALIGCGFIGRFHSRNIRAVLRSERVPGRYAAVSDVVAERAESFSRLTGAKALASADEVFALPGLNALYVCTETANHPALVAEAARRGLAVFCEKPLARTLPEVRQMVAAVDAAGVQNQVGLVLRYSPVFTVLADLMRDPALGPLLTAFLRDDQYFPTRGQYGSAWRGDVAMAGGGTLIEHSIHDVDLFHWLFGPVASVNCTTRITSGHPGVEDVAVARFIHAGGQTTTLISAWHQIDERPSTRRLEVFFEGGWFATDHDFIGPIRYQLRSGPDVVLDAEEVFARAVALWGLDEEEAVFARTGILEDYRFLQRVQDGAPCFPDFRVALAAHEVVDACYRSAASGREVRLG